MRILIAIDGSEFGSSAVRFISRVIGKDAGIDMKIITIIEPVAGTELEMIIESTEQLLDPHNPQAQTAAEVLRQSKELMTESMAGKDFSVSTKILAGPVARSIVEEAESWKADLIVLGSHGYGFWKRAWLGSVTDRVMSHAHCSVLVVRDGDSGR